MSWVPITASAYSPQSNGLAEAFVKTFKRDYVTTPNSGMPRPFWLRSVAGSAE